MKGSILQLSSNHKRKKVNENDQSKIFLIIIIKCFDPFRLFLPHLSGNFVRQFVQFY